MEKQLTNRDWCLSPDEEKVFKASPQATATITGEHTLAQIEVLQASFAENIVSNASDNIVVEAVKVYGDAFYTNLNNINNVVLKTDFVVQELPKYELLDKRLQAGSISPFEFAQFISDYSYTPLTANFVANQNKPKFLKNLDDFYRDGGFANSIMGGFCSVLPNAFAAIGGFFIILGQVEGLIGDALSFINKIRNIEDPIKALFEKIKVKALIEAIKEKIKSVVEGAINKITDAIKNFNMQNVIDQVENFIQSNIIAKVNQLKNSIMRTFSEENIKKIKAKVQGMIDYAVGLFDNPSIEEILFLMARICGFAAGVESILNGSKLPLDNITNNYRDMVNTVKATSGLVTAKAIKAGAPRFTDAVRREMIEDQKKIWKSVLPEYRPDRLPDLPGTDALVDMARRALDDLGGENSNGEKTRIPLGEVGATPEERAQIPSWEEVKRGNHPIFALSGGWMSRERPRSEGGGLYVGAEGWNQMEEDTLIRLLRLQKAMGIGPLRINSLWRSDEYQRLINPDVENSQHELGLAADILCTDNNWNSRVRERFVIEARGVGFTTFGFYKSKGFIHVDSRKDKVNDWGSNW